ncbi:MAG: 4-(cytidine 5'-diphospho)-2-C-methyl-D-erythritol kinase [Candidatus Gracilibacteria bacterium]|jgi:4-diphosphocytidyl-2-C-methyl-D-erythritol kinase
MKLKSYAKINLCLDILGRDKKTGFHFIKTIFHEIPHLYDEIEITQSKKDEIIINKPIPKEENLAYKALILLKKELKIKKCVQIKIKKNIPISSGLGGGSSNAATVLNGLNKLWKLKLSDKRLMELGAKLGMDVPFFIVGGTALGTHFGEKITPLNPLKGINFKFKFSKKIPKKDKSKNAYKNINLKKCAKNSQKTQILLKELNKKTPNKKTIISCFHNDFEIFDKIALQKNYHLSGAGNAKFSIIISK